MSSYGQFCPVARAAEIFAERWTPLILRELLLGSERFNELEAGLPRISRSLLTTRLRSLERDGLITRQLDEQHRQPRYHLTGPGQELAAIVESLGVWGQRWIDRDVSDDEIDTTLLMWDMHRRIAQDRLPPERVVAEFEFTGARRERYWLILERREVSVCLHFPGFETDLLVVADTEAMHHVWMGRLSLESALRHGLITLQGPRSLCRAFPDWLQLGTFAHVRPASQTEATAPLMAG